MYISFFRIYVFGKTSDVLDGCFGWGKMLKNDCDNKNRTIT